MMRLKPSHFQRISLLALWLSVSVDNAAIPRLKETATKSGWDFSKADWTGDAPLERRHEGLLTRHSRLRLRTSGTIQRDLETADREPCADRRGGYWTRSSQRLDRWAEYQHLMTLGLMKWLPPPPPLSEECRQSLQSVTSGLDFTAAGSFKSRALTGANVTCIWVHRRGECKCNVW